MYPSKENFRRLEQFEYHFLHEKESKKKLSNYRPLKPNLQTINNNNNNKRLIIFVNLLIEQAGFRKKVQHYESWIKNIKEKTEYSVKLNIVFVDYNKALESVEIWAMIESLQKCRIISRYTELYEKIQKHSQEDYIQR